MNTTNRSIAKWAGTAEVTPQPGNLILGTATGAYVAVVGLAYSESEFRSRVEHAMCAMDFELINIEDVRELSLEADLAEFDHTLRERVHALHDGNPVELGNFHTFHD